MRPRRKWINEKWSPIQSSEHGRKISHQQQQAMKRRILWHAQWAHTDLFTKIFLLSSGIVQEQHGNFLNAQVRNLQYNEETRTLKRRNHSNLLRKRRPISSSFSYEYNSYRKTLNKSFQWCLQKMSRWKPGNHHTWYQHVHCHTSYWQLPDLHHFQFYVIFSFSSRRVFMSAWGLLK